VVAQLTEVERHRLLHLEEQLRQRVAAVRMQERMGDRILEVDDGRQRLRRVDHPAAQWQALQPESLTLVHQQRGSPFVDVEHETWSAHTLTCSCPQRYANVDSYPRPGAKTTLMLPNRPAAAA